MENQRAHTGFKGQLLPNSSQLDEGLLLQFDHCILEL